MSRGKPKERGPAVRSPSDLGRGRARPAAPRAVVALWCIALGLSVLAVRPAHSQAESYPPDFGPYEQLRQQAHAQCQAYARQGGDAYRACLVQLAARPFGPCMSRDFAVYQHCVAAMTAGYPYPGRPVLTRQAYQVEVAGGVQRERDPATNQVRREARIPPRVWFTLQRHPQGVYRGVSYGQDGRPSSAYWVSAACELLGRDGRPAMDGMYCPVFPDKPYLMYLVRPPAPGYAPSAVFFKAGMLQDDFDGDGKAEPGYLSTTGGAGEGWSSGGGIAMGYDPATRFLKYEYQFFAHQGGAAGNFIVERLLLFRVR